MADLPQRFQSAIDHFDAANSDDPTKFDGVAAEIIYARRMSQWLSRLYPDAPEALQLAARSQHIRRWCIPRSSYPMNRSGYHRWRTALYRFHSDTAAEILRRVGYDDQTIARVGSLLRKEKLKTDPQTQALEDVACLVFLEYYFADFAARHDDQKVIEILRRTWKKMSQRGKAAAMELQMAPEARRLVEQALG